MKVKEFSIKLDKDHFQSGEKVTGKIVAHTEDPNLGDQAKIFLKFYDKLNIEWDEHQTHSIYTRVFSTLRKPFQVNVEEFYDKKNVSVMTIKHDNEYDTGILEFTYTFAFQLPEFLQGTIKLPNASCNYFIKAYLTDDASVSLHYQKGVNVFETFFKSLNHTYCKEEVKIGNKIMEPSSIIPQVQRYETQSSNYKVLLTLPKGVFFSDELMHVHVEIEHANPSEKTEILKLHKVSFKLFQYCKVYAEKPYRKSNLFYYMISHSSKKTFENCYADSSIKNKLIIDEQILIPKNILSTTSKRFNENIDVDYFDEPEDDELLVNGIRINYKLGVEIWRNIFVEDAEINIPIMINPEI
jgi:hypothetical protein